LEPLEHASMGLACIHPVRNVIHRKRKENIEYIIFEKMKQSLTKRSVVVN
jgi:hypothetical protein